VQDADNDRDIATSPLEISWRARAFEDTSDFLAGALKLVLYGTKEWESERRRAIEEFWAEENHSPPP